MSEYRVDEICRYEKDFTTRNFNKMMDRKAVIVAGTNYGMSKKMVQLMAEQGTKVFVTACGKEKLSTVIVDIREKTGNDITGIIVDSSRPEECKKVSEKALGVYGGTDVLINNAGKRGLITVDTVSDEVIDQIVDTDVKGPLYLYREAARYFLKKDSGNIINISSANGIHPICSTAYCATKSGLSTLTKNVVIRRTGIDVCCNAVAPGHTPSLTVYAHNDDGPQTLAEGVMNEVRNTRTVRSVYPWEIGQAYVVLFLASGVSRYIDGEVLSANCGCYL